jgi:hypothetical protein
MQGAGPTAWNDASVSVVAAVCTVRHTPSHEDPRVLRARQRLGGEALSGRPMSRTATWTANSCRRCLRSVLGVRPPRIRAIVVWAASTRLASWRLETLEKCSRTGSTRSPPLALPAVGGDDLLEVGDESGLDVVEAVGFSADEDGVGWLDMSAMEETAGAASARASAGRRTCIRGAPGIRRGRFGSFHNCQVLCWAGFAGGGGRVDGAAWLRSSRRMTRPAIGGAPSAECWPFMCPAPRASAERTALG